MNRVYWSMSSLSSPKSAAGEIIYINIFYKIFFGVIVELLTGKDGVVREAKLHAGKSHMERAVQHLYTP